MANYLVRNKKYKKAVIGIYADSFNQKTGVTQPYINFVKLFGSPYLITTDTTFEQVRDNCDMLIVPGGADVNSLRYNEPPHPANSRVNMHYEWMDENILIPFIKTGKPIFGICRGFQTINVALGGTLYQNIVGHVQNSGRSVTTDSMIITEEGKADVYTPVKSMHHQAVKELGQGLVPIGFTAVYENCETLQETEHLYKHNFYVKNKQGEKELVNYRTLCEAFRHESLPILAVQYHPEEFNCKFAIQEIDKMLNESMVPETKYILS